MKELSYRSFYKVGNFITFEEKEQPISEAHIPLCLEEHLKKIKLEAEAIVRYYPNDFEERGKE